MADLWFHPAHRKTKEMANKLHLKPEQYFKDIITVSSTSTIKKFHKVIGIGLLLMSPSQEKVLMSSGALLNLRNKNSSYPSRNSRETRLASPTTRMYKREQSTSFLS
jgi:hypothetical protein